MGGDGEDQGSADHIRQYQPGPDGAEDEEGDLSGGRTEEVVVESVCDWRGISLGCEFLESSLHVYIHIYVEVIFEDGEFGNEALGKSGNVPYPSVPMTIMEKMN